MKEQKRKSAAPKSEKNKISTPKFKMPKIELKKKSDEKSMKGNGNIRSTGIHGIGLKLLLAFFVPVICLVLLGTISYTKASDIVITNGVDDMTQTVHMMAEYYRSSLGFVQSKVDEFYPETQEYVDGDYAVSELAEIQFRNATYDSMKDVLWSDTNVNSISILTAKAQSILTTDKEDDGLYNALLETSLGQKLMSDRRNYHWFGRNPEIDAILGTQEDSYIFRFAMAFRKEDAFLVSEIKESLVVSIMESLDFGEGSIMGMVSADGTEIAYLNGESVINGGYFTDLAFPQGGTTVISEEIIVDEEAAQGEGAQEEVANTAQASYVEYEGTSYLYFESDVMADELKVCVLVPERVVVEPTAVIRNLTVALVIIACVLAMVIGISFASNISRVIAKINKHLGKIAQGDLTSHLKMKGKDEFAILADGVNNMTDNVCALVGEVRAVGKSLLEDVQEVADATDQFVNSTETIKDSIKEIEQGVRLLDENSTDSLSQMSILSARFQEVNDNTSGIGKATDHTAEAINDGLHIMEELNDKTAETTEMMGSVSKTMEILQSRIADIDDIVNAIDDIASQTTLLSLNASIEAARAGEAGRGFSVVADEIRKLADQSLVSAGEIRKIIQEITAQTTMAGQSVENACDSVENQKDAVEKTTTSFHMMDEQTGVLMKQVRAILEVIQNMEIARSKTEGAIQSISAVAEETYASSSEVYHATEKQSVRAVALKQTSEQMLGHAAKLEQAIQKFTIEE